MEHKIVLSGNIELINIDKVLKQLTYDLSVETIRMDLSDVTFMEPAGLGLLTAYLNYIHSLAVSKQIDIKFFTIPPKNPSVNRYLQRMNFYDNVGIAMDESFIRHNGKGQFKEVLIINSEEECNNVAEDLTRILKTQTQIDDSFLSIMEYSVTEIAENIFHHASSVIGGVVCAQSYGNKVQICIIDAGKGIPQNIRTIKGCESYDDKNALEKAIELRVTSTPERNSGLGLFFSSQITAKNGGTFTIHSLNGSITLGRFGTRKKDAPFWQGTAIVFELPGKIKMSIKELMDKYYPPENDFEFIQEVENDN